MALSSILGLALLLTPATAPLPQGGGQSGPQVPGFAPPEQGDPMLEKKWQPTTEYELQLLELYGNFNVGIVGEEIITRFDVFGWLGSRQFEDPTINLPNLSPQERQNVQNTAALTQLIEQRLKIQGGRTQGYEEELIAGELEARFQRQIELLGGAQSAAAEFKRSGFTPEGYKEVLGEQLMAGLWEGSVIGRIPGASGRVIVDSFIRPGTQWARYQEYAESRSEEDNAIVGRTRNGKISMRRLVILVIPGGRSADEVKGEVETLRARISDGVLTFEEAVQNFAPPQFQGEESIVQDAFTKVLSQRFQEDYTTQREDVRAFVEEAEDGALSSVLEFNAAGTPQAYVLLKVLDRTKATEAMPFSDLEIQRRLRQKIADEASEVRISRGLADLVRTTHLAPEGLRQGFLASGRRFRKE